MKMELILLTPSREVVIGADPKFCDQFLCDYFTKQALASIKKNGKFTVALSGGSTPKNFYSMLSKVELPWNKVWLFWSDERTVPPTDASSNYKMAFDAGLKDLPLLKSHIFRLKGETNPKRSAKSYENAIKKHVPNASFDLILLGMGDDGHTASLFPGTLGLTANNELVVANFVPHLNTWRLSLTFKCINQAKKSLIYVTGEKKSALIAEIFINKGDKYPSSHVGTKEHPSIWLLDKPAALDLINYFPKLSPTVYT